MDGTPGSTEPVATKLTDICFESSQVMEAIKAVGPTLNEAVDYILTHSSWSSEGVSVSSNCPASVNNSRTLGKKCSSMSRPFGQMRQSSMMEHLQPIGKSKKRKTSNSSVLTASRTELLNGHLGGHVVEVKSHVEETLVSNRTLELSQLSNGSHPLERADHGMEIGPDWDQKANKLLQKHFGYFELKSFQKEALSAWLAHQDCLVLAATGEIFMFSATCTFDWEGCGCDVSVNKLDA